MEVSNLVQVTEYSKRLLESKEDKPENNFKISELGEAFKAQFNNTALGTLLRQYENTQNNLLQSYVPTESERVQIRNEIGFDEDYWDIVLRGAENFEQVKNNIEILKENKRMEQKLANSHWSVGLLTAPAAMAGDPVEAATLLGSVALAVAAPPAGGPVAAARGGAFLTRLGVVAATNAAAGAASNMVAHEIAGTEQDLWTSAFIAGGFAGGLYGMSAAARSLLDGTLGNVITTHNNRLNLAGAGGSIKEGETKTLSDVVPNPTPVPKNIFDRINDVREQITSGLPSVEVKQRIRGYIEDPEIPEEVKNVLRRISHYEEGVGGPKDHKQYLVRGRLYMEEVNNLHLRDNFYSDILPNVQANLVNKYGKDNVTEFIYIKLENGTVPKRLENLERNEDLKKLIEVYRKSYTERSRELIAEGIISKTFNNGFYSPLILDLQKIYSFVRDFNKNGNLIKGTLPQDYLADYLYRGVKDGGGDYLERLEAIYKQRLAEEAKKYKNKGQEKAQEKLGKTFDDWLKKEAAGSAKEFLDQGRSGRTAASENYDDFAVGFRFSKHRLPWNVAYADPNYNGFSLNQLRLNAIEAHRIYRARSTGALADKRIFKTDYDGVEKIFSDLGDKVNEAKKLKPDVRENFIKDLNTMHRRAYSMVLVDGQNRYGISDALSRILRNINFASMGAFMALNSLMELSRAIRAYGLFSMFKLVPFAGTLFKRWANNGFTKQDIKSIKAFIIGDELRTKLDLSASVQTAAETFKNVTDWKPFNRFLSTAVGITDFMATNTPSGALMRYATLRINDVYQTYALNELIQLAYKRPYKHRGFVSDETLRKINITKKEFNHTLEALKFFYTMDSKGNIKSIRPIERLGRDPVAIYTLRRFMRFINEETMQRRNIDDIFIWDRAKMNPIMNLALQFKTFSIQSYRKRFVKFLNTGSDEGKWAAANLFLTSAALTSIITLGTIYVRSLGLKEKSKEDYYERSLGVRKFSDLTKPENFGNFVFYTMFNRMPETAAFSLMLNSMGIGTGTKTTASTGDSKEDDSLFIKNSQVTQTLTDMIPAGRSINAFRNIMVGSVNYEVNAITDSFTKAEENATTKQLLKVFDVAPTVPVLSNMLKEELKEGTETDKHKL